VTDTTAELVHGISGTSYHCRTVAGTDRHLDHLRRVLSRERGKLRARTLVDVDRLLDRRLELSGMEGR